MEQELRFGLDLARLGVMKKKGLGRLLAAFECVFSCSQGQKNAKKIFKTL